eukprot:366055-Chlamydomonas_euryale.AAC.19
MKSSAAAVVCPWPGRASCSALRHTGNQGGHASGVDDQVGLQKTVGPKCRGVWWGGGEGDTGWTGWVRGMDRLGGGRGGGVGW